MSKVCININGQIVEKQNAMISVFDRGFLFGDSIYEVSYTQNRSILFYDEHYARLENSAKLLNMQLQFSKEQITQNILQTLKVSNIDDAYFRLIITRGESEISLNPKSATQNNFIIIVKPKPTHKKELYQKGIDLLLSSVIRNDINSINPNAKSGNYLNNIMAIDEASKKGFSDAIMLNKEGLVTEGTTFNIWSIKNGCIKTPKIGNGILAGITRDKIIGLKDQYQIIQDNMSVQDLKEAQEVFITSSTRGVMPVSKIHIDNKDYFYTNNTTLNIRNSYNSLVEKHIKNTLYRY
ncbi:MAG: aminotransferase class IV [Bacteriovoracaceae bacterium]|jgi:branched-chain amino acid aminotransferase|nr:aminotransferase class IV [Bacteriovoracaceae bacterium]